jgi:hypothetical protein
MNWLSNVVNTLFGEAVPHRHEAGADARFERVTYNDGGEEITVTYFDGKPQETEWRGTHWNSAGEKWTNDS